MRAFVLKTILIFILAFLIIAAKILYANFAHIRTHGLKYMPLNNLSNSQCFNAKLDQMETSAQFKHCDFLVTGSSMALNNISGEILDKKLGKITYNIGAWGTKPEQVFYQLQALDLSKIKAVLYVFNNVDFGNTNYVVDYPTMTKTLSGNIFEKAFIFINKFNIEKFNEDWNYKARYSPSNAVAESLNFDKYGSVLLDSTGFKRSLKRWNYYEDSTGFAIFKKSIIDIQDLCRTKNIRFTIVYLPQRQGLLTAEMISKNDFIASEISKISGRNFIDLQKLTLPAGFFCDAKHLFRQGAESVTNSISDSLRLKVR